MSYTTRQMKKSQKIMNKHHKRVSKEILKDIDLTDKIELSAFAYLQTVNDQFNNIVNRLDEIEKLIESK